MDSALGSVQFLGFPKTLDTIPEDLAAREDFERCLVLIQKLTKHVEDETVARKTEFASLSKNVQESLDQSVVKFKEELAETSRNFVRTEEITLFSESFLVLDANYTELRQTQEKLQQTQENLFEMLSSLKSRVDDAEDAAFLAKRTSSKMEAEIIQPVKAMSKNISSFGELLATLQAQVDHMQGDLSGLEGELKKIQAAPKPVQDPASNPQKFFSQNAIIADRTTQMASHEDSQLHLIRPPLQHLGNTGSGENVFLNFCGNGKTDMDGQGFAKLAKELDLLDKRCTATDIDIIFAKVVEKGQRRIGFQQFETALSYIAQKKAVHVDSVFRAVENATCRALNATQIAAVRLHDDKSTYTGVHVNGGPDVGMKGSGFVPLTPRRY
jgi:hypothetical protein